jgi:hypothetical protein
MVEVPLPIEHGLHARGGETAERAGASGLGGVAVVVREAGLRPTARLGQVEEGAYL